MLVMYKKEGAYYGIADPVIASAKIHFDGLSKDYKCNCDKEEEKDKETDSESEYDTILQLTIKGKFKVLPEYKERDDLTKEFEDLVNKYIASKVNKNLKE